MCKASERVHFSLARGSYGAVALAALRLNHDNEAAGARAARCALARQRRSHFACDPDSPSRAPAAGHCWARASCRRRARVSPPTECVHGYLEHKPHFSWAPQLGQCYCIGSAWPAIAPEQAPARTRYQSGGSNFSNSDLVANTRRPPNCSTPAPRARAL